MVGGLLVGFVWLNLLFSVSWLVDFQWASCGSIFSFLCHGWQTFSGVRVALQTFNGVRVSQSSFLCHGWQTFSGVRVALSLVFCVMVGRLLVGFVWLNLQISVSCQVDFQWVSCVSIFSFLCHDRQTFWWVSCGSIFSFLCHGRQTFIGVRVAQSLVFCVMIGRLLVGFVWLNLQISVSWLVDFQWGSCVSIQFSVSWLVDFQCDSCGSIFSFLCHGRQTFRGVRVAQSLVFCVMVGRILVGFVWLNLQFSVSWQVDFQWGSCGSIFSLLCHDRQTFSGVRVAQSLVFCVMVGRHLVGFVWLNLQLSVSWLVDFQWVSCGSIFSFLCHGRQTFSEVRVAQSFVFCVMVGRLLVGFVWPIFSFLCHGWQTFIGVRVAQSLVFCVMVGRHLVGFVWLNLQISVSWLVDFQWGSCGSIFCFLCQGCQILVGFVWLNLQFSVSWLVDFQWGSCGSIFSFLRHGSHTFSGVRVSQSLVFCVMVGRLLVGFVWPKHLFSVSWQVDFQWGSCGSIFSFLCHGWQTFSGVREAQSLVFWVKVGDFQWGSCGSIFTFLSHGWQTFSGFVWLNLQISVSWQVYFQWGSCVSIFSFLCHGRQTFSGVRVAQSLVFCVMVGRILVGFVWLNLQFSVSWLVDFQWGSCGSIFSLLCHDRQTFSGVRVSQSLVFCVMIGRLLVGFVWLNLQISVSWLVDFQWGSCVSIQFSVSWQVDFQWGSCGSIFSFLCHGWQNFRGVRVAQTLVFCVMVGRLLVGFVWLNLQSSVS